MGRMERTMARKAKRAEKVLPNELADLRKVRQDWNEAKERADEAAMQAAEAQTRHDYCVMQLRHKYSLKVGDQINPDDGKITRAP